MEIMTAPNEIKYGQTETSLVIKGFEIFTAYASLRQQQGYSQEHIIWAHQSHDINYLFRYLAYRMSRFMVAMNGKGFLNYWLEVNIPDEGECDFITLVLWRPGNGGKTARYQTSIYKDLLWEIGRPKINTGRAAA
jgi:hypothetical protein